MTVETAIPPEAETRPTSQYGLAAGFSAFLLWGLLPLLFKLLDDVSPLTIVADRTLWSLVLVGAILFAGARWREVRSALADAATLRSMVISAVLLAANWLLYVWAVANGHVLEASFGYFINPMVNVAIGMVLLGERQNRWQALAIGIALVALALQSIGIGSVPFIALGLAISFGFYGFFRKTAKVGSAVGLFVETLVLAPLAIAYLGCTFWQDGGVGPHGNARDFLLLMLCGPATAVPLLLFAYGAQRLRLTTVGMLQYLAPSIQFCLAITVFGESLNPLRLLSFGLIWVSLAIFSADSLFRRGKAMG